MEGETSGSISGSLSRWHVKKVTCHHTLTPTIRKRPVGLQRAKVYHADKLEKKEREKINYITMVMMEWFDALLWSLNYSTALCGVYMCTLLTDDTYDGVVQHSSCSFSRPELCPSVLRWLEEAFFLEKKWLEEAFRSASWRFLALFSSPSRPPQKPFSPFLSQRYILAYAYTSSKKRSRSRRLLCVLKCGGGRHRCTPASAGRWHRCTSLCWLVLPIPAGYFLIEHSR